MFEFRNDIDMYENYGVQMLFDKKAHSSYRIKTKISYLQPWWHLKQRKALI